MVRTRSLNAVEAAFRGEWNALVATVVRDVGDLALAEDVVSDAFAEAAERWHRDGIPQRPGAWLLTTARRKAIDRIRRDRRFSDRLPALAALVERTGPVADTGDPAERGPGGGRRLEDDQLALVFGCCHPSLAPEAQVALTLRYVAGLSTGQIARAFLVPEATMAKRLVRAKHKIAAAAVPLEIPSEDRLDERLGAVCGVVYAVFTEGHASARGAALLRGDLCDEALFLADTLVTLLPANHDVLSLRALCRLTDSRRVARVDADGLPVLLRDQDRSRWDATKIADGLADLAAAQAAMPDAGASPYFPMAVLAAVHAGAPSYADTDWSAIVAVYDSMLAADRGPVLLLNRAVAVGERDGPAAGLELVDGLAIEHADQLESYHYLHAARAEFLVRLGRPGDAGAALATAIDRCDNEAERSWLERRRREVSADRRSAEHPTTTPLAVDDPGSTVAGTGRATRTVPPNT